MDCDCVQYAGKVHIIPATGRALDKLYDDINRWTDGPFSLHLVRPSEAEQVRYRSRDRIMEAYEDGHPHCVHTGPL